MRSALPLFNRSPEVPHHDVPFGLHSHFGRKLKLVEIGERSGARFPRVAPVVEYGVKEYGVKVSDDLRSRLAVPEVPRFWVGCSENSSTSEHSEHSVEECCLAFMVAFGQAFQGAPSLRAQPERDGFLVSHAS